MLISITICFFMTVLTGALKPVLTFYLRGLTCLPVASSACRATVSLLSIPSDCCLESLNPHVPTKSLQLPCFCRQYRQLAPLLLLPGASPSYSHPSTVTLSAIARPPMPPSRFQVCVSLLPLPPARVTPFFGFDTNIALLQG
jgi:hypothetical protein